VLGQSWSNTFALDVRLDMIMMIMGIGPDSSSSLFDLNSLPMVDMICFYLHFSM